MNRSIEKKLIICLTLLILFASPQRGWSDEESSDDENKEPPRRALPAPFPSPPFPSGEFQGYPLVGVPPSDTVYPFMKFIYKTPWGDCIKKSGVQLYGWINASANEAPVNIQIHPIPIGSFLIVSNWINFCFV